MILKNPKAERCENKSAGDIDEMMLIGEDRGERDQNEPDNKGSPNHSVRPADINVRQN